MWSRTDRYFGKAKNGKQGHEAQRAGEPKTLKNSIELTKQDTRLRRVNILRNISENITFKKQDKAAYQR